MKCEHSDYGIYIIVNTRPYYIDTKQYSFREAHTCNRWISAILRDLSANISVDLYVSDGRLPDLMLSGLCNSADLQMRHQKLFTLARHLQ